MTKISPMTQVDQARGLARARQKFGAEPEEMEWPKVETGFTGVLTFSYVNGKPMKAMVTKVTMA